MAESTDLATRYRRSQELLSRALKVVPLGSQTFSKSHMGFPSRAAPHFLVRGEGARVWDVDGNEYIDLVCGLLPVVLGYCDPDVNQAIRAQLERGTTFSLASELEVELAEELVALIPCAEQVRYGKNGSDATAGAVRLARALTGHDRVACCGYHGWQDWYIGATARHAGVPGAVRELTHLFDYNDLGSLERVLASHPGEFACVIMEPMNLVEPEPGFLAGCRDLVHDHGGLFILDEIITGFRFHLGGAQSLFGVTPDLATFGKSMANGMPISAVVGRADLMRGMEEIFFSFTFGGEALSLAAALATVRKMKREPVIDTLWQRGEQLQQGVAQAIERQGLSDRLGVTGKPCWTIMTFADGPGATLWELKSLLLQELLLRGVLTGGGHNISYALTPSQVERVVTAYDQALGVVAQALEAGDLRSRLAGPPIEPLFKVRG